MLLTNKWFPVSWYQDLLLSSKQDVNFTKCESMTKKSHQKFWWMKIQKFFWEKVKLGKFSTKYERFSPLSTGTYFFYKKRLWPYPGTLCSQCYCWQGFKLQTLCTSMTEQNAFYDNRNPQLPHPLLVVHFPQCHFFLHVYALFIFVHHTNQVWAISLPGCNAKNVCYTAVPGSWPTVPQIQISVFIIKQINSWLKCNMDWFMCFCFMHFFCLVVWSSVPQNSC